MHKKPLEKYQFRAKIDQLLDKVEKVWYNQVKIEKQTNTRREKTKAQITSRAIDSITVWTVMSNGTKVGFNKYAHIENAQSRVDELSGYGYDVTQAQRALDQLQEIISA